KEEAYFGGAMQGSLLKEERRILEKTYWLLLRPLYELVQQVNKDDFTMLFNEVDLVDHAFRSWLASEDQKDLPLQLIAQETDDPVYYYQILSESTNHSPRQVFYCSIQDFQVRKALENIPNKTGYRIGMETAERRLYDRLQQITTDAPVPHVNQVKIKGSSFERWLDPNCFSDLFDEKGQIKAMPGSAHCVARSGALYFKM